MAKVPQQLTGNLPQFCQIRGIEPNLRTIEIDKNDCSGSLNWVSSMTNATMTPSSRTPMLGLAAFLAVLAIVWPWLYPNLKMGIVEWVLSGLNATQGTNYLMFIPLVATLGIALFRRQHLLKQQKALVHKQEQEIDLTHRAMDAHAMVCLTDARAIITHANEKFLKTYGYQRSEVIGKSISMLYPKGLDDPVFQTIGRKLIAGQTWTGESEEIASDGSTVHVHCSVVPLIDTDGSHVRTVAIRTDNSESHLAQNARFLKSLFDHLQDQVYIYDVETLRMRYANLLAIQSSGWTEAEVINKRITDTDRNFDETLFRGHVAPLLSGEKDVVTVEISRGNSFGEINTRLHISDNGQPLFLSILRDTTERIKTERAKMESVSVVTHELRTPLTSIKGALRLLSSGALGTLNDKAQSVLDIAVRNSDRLLMVVDDILDLEKIRAGKMELNCAPVNLATFVADVVEMNTGYADEHNVTFDFETELTQANANIAAERMMQVFSNLLSNAAKYSPERGSVKVSLTQDGAFWRISVQDSGPGIPESGRKSVFESFSQIESSDGQKRKGTGLGLTISQKIVHAHNGVIDFESEVGKGTTFFVKLPMMNVTGTKQTSNDTTAEVRTMIAE